MLRLAFTLLFSLFLAGAACAERRVALVMAADGYRTLRPLGNAVRDGVAVAETLRTLGFDVTLETDRDLRRMRRALEDFVGDAGKADVALVFFAGHGVEIAGENRLLPVDADASSLSALKQTTLPLDEVRAAVAGIAPVGLIVLDACRDDPFGLAGAGGRGAVALRKDILQGARPGLGRLGRAENILFAFSAAPGQTASDGDGENSPFTTALTKYFATEGLEVRSVLTLVQQEVYDFSRGKQLPYVESGLPRLFFASSADAQLPERERLLLAMADITPDLRGVVETIAAERDMPLAPLYGALIGSDVGALGIDERETKLREAADAFVAVREEMRTIASADPRVAMLRSEAEAQLSLGAFDTARGKLTEAASIDSLSRRTLKDNLIERTLSEAATHFLNGGAARAKLRHATAAGDYEKAAALYAELESLGIPPQSRKSQSEILDALGATRSLLGDLPAAERAFEALLRATETGLAEQPDDLEAAHRLAHANVRIGDARDAAGNLAGAKASYSAARDLWRDLAARDPDDQDWLRQLSLAHNRLGGIERAAGDLSAAAQSYQEGLRLIERLSLAEPESAVYRADLMTSYSRLGGVRQASGDTEAALAAYQRSLMLAIDLAGKDADDIGRQSDLVIAHHKIGDLRLARLELPAALTAYQAARAVAAPLVARDPENTGVLRDYSITLDGIGNTLRAGSDPQGALAAYEEGLGIAERLAALDPANTVWRRDTEIGHANVGMARRDAGNLDGAIASFEKALAIAVDLEARDPASALWKRDLAVNHSRVGDMKRVTGALAAARDHYQKSFAINEVLAQNDPSDPAPQLGLVVGLYNLSTVGVEPGASLDKALAILRRLKADGRLPPANEGMIRVIEQERAALDENPKR